MTASFGACRGDAAFAREGGWGVAAFDAAAASKVPKPPELLVRGACRWCGPRPVRGPPPRLEHRDLDPVRALTATALGVAEAGAEVVNLGVAPAVDAIADASNVDPAPQAAHVDPHDEELPALSGAAGEGRADAFEAGPQVRDPVPATYDQAPSGGAAARTDVGRDWRSLRPNRLLRTGRASRAGRAGRTGGTRRARRAVADIERLVTQGDLDAAGR